MDNFKLINRICYGTAMLSIIVGAGIGLAAVWVEDLMFTDFTEKGLFTTGILFAASTLGAIITSLLVSRDESA